MAEELRESAEDYLESILVLSGQKEFVRAADICHYFGYSRPTVSIVLKDFRSRGFIEVDANNHITLTEKGLQIAQSVYERHQLFVEILVSMGVPEEIAKLDACRLEHDVHPETYAVIKNYCESHSFPGIKADQAPED